MSAVEQPSAGRMARSTAVSTHDTTRSTEVSTHDTTSNAIELATTIEWRRLTLDDAKEIASRDDEDERAVLVLCDEPLWVANGSETHMTRVEFRPADDVDELCGPVAAYAIEDDDEMIDTGPIADMLFGAEQHAGFLVWAETPDWFALANEMANGGAA